LQCRDVANVAMGVARGRVPLAPDPFHERGSRVVRDVDRTERAPQPPPPRAVPVAADAR
jgi:hypothetical protein